ncbi:D-aminoacylase [Orchesella cincta]|uniref:D-aminoacylase n=1 Tax=Orchesella cincta TaxID=48709 RepID=A0A1D2NHH6_ORCCI|nr:D-aminoacylase [Orchesella cincta]
MFDGAGSPWFLGSVGVLNGSIAVIQPNGSSTTPIPSKLVISANGDYLTPGFFDSHTHDDIGILENGPAIAKILQGVTTIVTGNCGFSTYPYGSLERVKEHLESLLGEVDSRHGPLRLSVMEFANREANETEIQKMCEILEEQLVQGAAGLSLGLMYSPSNYASQSELVALGKIVAKYGRLLAAHIRTYEGGLVESVEEFVRVLRESGARGLLSHLQTAGKPYWGTRMTRALEVLEIAREEGIDIAVDMYPYLAGSSTILQLLPPSSMQEGFDEFLRKIQNASYVESLRELTESGQEPGWESKVGLIGWENITVGSVDEPNFKRFEGMNVTAAARSIGLPEFDFFLLLVVEDLGRTNVIMFQQSQDDQNLVFGSRLQMVGSDSIPRSGGKPHPRGYGTFPRVLKHYVRENRIINLEEGVRKMTSMTAHRFGILNRGIIRNGMAADLVMFDDSFEDGATFEDPTKAPTQIHGVWINGEMVVDQNGLIIGGNSNPRKPGTVLTGNENQPSKVANKSKPK